MISQPCYWPVRVGDERENSLCMADLLAEISIFVNFFLFCPIIICNLTIYHDNI